MKTGRALIAWQKEFFSGPTVYWTESLGEPTGNFYDSAEAADLEVQWAAAQHGLYAHPTVSIRRTPVHTLKLSRDRWAKDGQ